MNITDQLLSFSLSKKLKELGVKQKSLFYWFRQFKDDHYLLHCIDYNHHEIDLKIFIDHFPDYYSAFTVAELGDLLPLTWNSGKRDSKDYICSLFKKNISNGLHAFGETEADARAKMLIFILENHET